jgi:DNA-dependent RNA polymerase auxiliary subunit epsilon
MTIFAVEFRRDQTATIYVEAEDEAAARDDAVELLYFADWETEDEDIEYVFDAGDRFRGRFWTGGENGDWDHV